MVDRTIGSSMSTMNLANYIEESGGASSDISKPMMVAREGTAEVGALETYPVHVVSL